MDKILFSNSFKNLMVTLGAKTSNSNYAVPVVTAGSGTTAGTPQGFMEMSALASVLGAGLLFYAPQITTTGTNLSNYVSDPIYRCPSGDVAISITDKPSDLTVRLGFLLFNLKPYGDDSFMCQILIQGINIWIRRRTNQATSAAVFSNWNKVNTTEVS